MTTKQYLQLQDIYAENCDASGNQTNLYPALGLGVRGNYQVSLMNASALDTTGVDSWLFAIGQDFDAGTTILYENPNVTYAVNGTSGTFTVTEVSGLDTSEMKDWIGAEETPTVVGELIGMGADHNKNKPVSLVQWRMFIRNRVDYEGQEMDVVPDYVTSGMLAEALGGVPSFSASAEMTGDNPLWTETKPHPEGFPVYTVYKVATPFTLNIDDDSVAATGFLQGLYMYQDPVEGQVVGQMTRNLSLTIADSGNGVWTGSDEVTYQWEDGEYEFPEEPVPTTVSISVAINRTAETVDGMAPGEVRVTVGGNTAIGYTYFVSPKTFIAKAGGDFTGEIGVHRLKSGSVNIPVKPSPSGVDYFAFNYDEETGLGNVYPCIQFSQNPSLSPNGEDSIEFQNATTVQWRKRRGTRVSTIESRFTYPLVYDGSKYYGEYYFTTYATSPAVLVGNAVTYLSQSTLSRKNDAWMLEVSLSSDLVGAYKNVYRSEIDTSQIMDLVPYATVSGGVFENGIEDGRQGERHSYYSTDGLEGNVEEFVLPTIIAGSRWGIKSKSSVSVQMDDDTAFIPSGLIMLSGEFGDEETPFDIYFTKTGDGTFTASGAFGPDGLFKWFCDLTVDEDGAFLNIDIQAETPTPTDFATMTGDSEEIVVDSYLPYATYSDIQQALSGDMYIPVSGGTFTGAISAYDGNQYATSGQYEEMIQSRIDNPEYAGDNYLPTITASADAFNPCGPLGNPSFIANQLFQAYQQYDRPSYGHPGYVTRDLKWTTKSPSMNWDGGTLYDQFAEWTWLHKPVTVADGTDHNYYITSRYVGMNGGKARFEMDCWKID